MYYSPSVVSAFSSVLNIVSAGHLGGLNRSIHRWSGSSMVSALILHAFRVYLTGGFKKPRELIWMTGVILGLCTVSFGVTGYSLPWDQVAYWACKIVTATPEALDELFPGIGTLLVLGLRAGYSVTQSTLTRLYSIHTFLLPVITLTLVIVHFIQIRKQGISG